MDINDSVMSMSKGWVVSYNDGTIITEYDKNGVETNWRQVPKVGIKSLTLKWNDKHWTIAGKDCYLQFKRAWIAPGMAEPVTEERCIGYWEGNDKVIYRVNEATGQMKMDVKSIAKEQD